MFHYTKTAQQCPLHQYDHYVPTQETQCSVHNVQYTLFYGYSTLKSLRLIHSIYWVKVLLIPVIQSDTMKLAIEKQLRILFYMLF